MSGLRISADLELPVEFAGEASAILARRGRGKTYTASVIAEELVAAGQPFVVLDPVGVWWGLRSSADGKKPGLEVTILGGEHSDVPLDPSTGTPIATFVVDNPGAYVLDLSLFESKAAQDRFVTDFAERVYRYKAAQERRTPLTIILDEADQFAPQRPISRDGLGPRMLGAWESVVRQGRARGLGCVLITQRPAVINKNVLTQAGALVLLGLTGPQDREAVEDWISGHASAQERKEVIGSLSGLAVGEAWVWWPTEELLERVQVRKRRTFDSSTTPKAGEHREAVRFADVDLDALKDAMADAIERARADDPKELRRRIVQLQKELKERPAETVTVTVVERVEVPVLTDDDRDVLRQAVAVVDKVRLALDDTRRVEDQPPAARVERRSADRKETSPRAAGSPSARGAKPPAPAVRRDVGTKDLSGDVTLSGPQRKLLAVLATYGPRTKRQLAMQAGYSAKGGGFNNPLSSLRSSGLVERGDPIVITEAGIEALGEFEPLPTGQALLDHWMGQLSGPERKILQPLVDCWPDSMSKDELADAAGYAPVGGGFNNPLSRLRTLELITRGQEIRLTDDFGEAIS